MSSQDGFTPLPPFNPAWLPSWTTSLMYPVIPVSFYQLIGAVAAFWGNFEIRASEMLSAFVAADNLPDDLGWERRAFKRRSDLLKLKVSARFPGPIAVEINEIMNQAAQLYWKRNIIVHGHFRMVNVPGMPVHAEGIHKGKLVKLPVTEESLGRLWNTLAALNGRLVRCADPLPEKHELSAADRTIIRDFILKHRPTSPAAHILAPSPAAPPA